MNKSESLPMCVLCTHTPICKNQPQQSCPYFQLKEEKKPPKPESNDVEQPKPRESFWKTTKTILVLLVVLSGIVLGFAAGRYSTKPRIVSQIPSVSKPVAPGLSPEDVIYKFYRYAQLHEVNNLTAVCHPELLEKRNSYLMSLLNNAPRTLADLEEINILNLQTEETATATVSLDLKERNKLEKIQLKKHDGEWRILSFN
jgi:hypothetical protein